MLRAFAFNGRLGVSSGVVMATLFVERLLDLLMVLVLLGVVLATFSLDVSNFAGIGSAALIGIAIGILFLLLFPQVFAPAAIAVGKFIARLAPKGGQKLLNEINKSLLTLVHLAKGNTMIRPCAVVYRCLAGRRLRVLVRSPGSFSYNNSGGRVAGFAGWDFGNPDPKYARIRWNI